MKTTLTAALIAATMTAMALAFAHAAPYSAGPADETRQAPGDVCLGPDVDIDTVRGGCDRGGTHLEYLLLPASSRGAVDMASLDGPRGTMPTETSLPIVKVGGEEQRLVDHDHESTPESYDDRNT